MITGGALRNFLWVLHIACAACCFATLQAVLPERVAAMEIQVVRETPQRDFAILFVHGLSGSADASFGNWPTIIEHDSEPILELPHDTIRLSDFSVFALDYSTTGTNFSISEIGRAFAVEIADHRLFRAYDMVWIVAHSMGGLITHQAFAQLLLQGKYVYFRFIPAILELGVPAEGSDFAEVAERFPRLVVRWLGYDPKLVSELQPGLPYIRNLNAEWADLIERHQRADGWPLVFCGYETIAESRIAELLGISDGVVVPRLYSSRVCSGAQQPISTTHIEMPKPTGPNDDAHKLLRTMIRESLIALGSEGNGRYTIAGSRSLFDVLTLLASTSASTTAVDRVTGLPLYRYRISFSDSMGLTTTTLVTDNVSGWSIQDAARRLVERYKACLEIKSESQNASAIFVEAREGSVCQ